MFRGIETGQYDFKTYMAEFLWRDDIFLIWIFGAFYQDSYGKRPESSPPPIDPTPRLTQHWRRYMISLLRSLSNAYQKSRKRYVVCLYQTRNGVSEA